MRGSGHGETTLKEVAGLDAEELFVLHELGFDQWPEDHEAAALERVASHEGLGGIVQANAVDHDARLADGVDQRPAGGVARM